MKISPLATGGVVVRLCPRRRTARRACAVAAALVLALAPNALATPFIWDEDTDRVDDRIESVNLLGYRFAFEHEDSLLRQRIEVARAGGTLVYSVYVLFDHAPNDSDLTAMTAQGMPVLHRYEAVPAVRSVATYSQVEAAAAMAGVERIEAVPVLYPMMREAVAAIGMRDPADQVFPTWEGSGGGNGDGIVIAFLDTGINDAPDGAYPGHEALAGRCLGGATFVNEDSTLDTPRDGSVNPVDRGGGVTQSHGTHVASLALGSGGSSGYAIGVAPGARFVDVKALNDAGFGTGIAEAIDWCIHNRARDWGGPPGFEGIDVINLSLSSPDETDGQDLASRLASRAVELGIVVVASMGNGGQAGFAPSPAGADRVLAVGAIDDQRTPLAGDDRVADFGNFGPRASDLDGDPMDEQKPDLLAPGVSILGADGDETTDGAQYSRLSGTSMAAALVSGAVAALRSSYPALSPADIAEVLRATAFRQLGGVPPGQGGSDPRWYSPIGFGALDLYAARLELEQPGRSQIARFELGASSSSGIGAVLRTQREYGPLTFTFERAPDSDGAPGAFAPYDSVIGTGDASLANASNRATYERDWSVPGNELGTAFWYRVAYVDGGIRYQTSPRRLVSPAGPSVATIEVTIVHNAYDHDVHAEIDVGGGSLPGLPGLNGNTPALVFPVPGSAAAYSSEWVNGASTTGNVAWTFRIEVPHGSAENYLPPDADHPWVLEVDEAGYLNRSGRVTAFRLTWHRTEGDLEFEGGPTPQQTAEGQTTRVVIPQGVTGVEVGPSEGGLRVGPNPVRGGDAVTFSSSRPPASELGIYDLSGREVGRAAFHASGAGYRARWETRGSGGRPLPSGVYFVRLGRSAAVRLVVLQP